MIRIRLPDTTEAVLEAGRWACTDERRERLLNAMRAPWNLGQTGDTETVKTAEWSEAHVISRVLGAEIIEARA